jgi:hypothetical protein
MFETHFSEAMSIRRHLRFYCTQIVYLPSNVHQEIFVISHFVVHEVGRPHGEAERRSRSRVRRLLVH